MSRNESTVRAALPTSHSPEPPDFALLHRYARIAGVLMLLSIVFGFLGEMYLPGMIVERGDAAATAANILLRPALFRLTFAAYLVEALCDVALCVVFYVLLRPVRPNVALLSAFFGIASMVTYAISRASFFSASLLLGDSAGLEAFTTEQRQALAYLALRIAATIATLFLSLYGVASMLRGYLFLRSGYVPRALGALLLLGGAGFFLRSVTYLVVPAWSSQLLLLPMLPAGLALMGYLLVRGVPAGSSPRAAV